MKNAKANKKKGSDIDKAIAKPGVSSVKEKNGESPSNIPSDTVLAEKDEVKIAEEKLRQKNKEKENKAK